MPVPHQVWILILLSCADSDIDSNIRSLRGKENAADTAVLCVSESAGGG